MWQGITRTNDAPIVTRLTFEITEKNGYKLCILHWGAEFIYIKSEGMLTARWLLFMINM